MLGFILVLLVGMTLALFHLNRGVLIEMKSSAHHQRAAAAFEAAEAGLEWATGMLNDPRFVSASCEPQPSAGESFRGRYVPLVDPAIVAAPHGAASGASGAVAGGSTASAAGSGSASPSPSASSAMAAGSVLLAFSPAANAAPGCRLDAGGLRCSCPLPTAALHFDDIYGPHFTVQFAGSNDPQSVVVTSTGCIGTGPACLPGAPLRELDAIATVAATLKLAPRLVRTPAAALTAGGDVSLIGLNLANITGPGGWLVHAGGSVSGGSVSGGGSGNGVLLRSSPGRPPETALAQNDPLLAALRGSDAAGAAGLAGGTGQAGNTTGSGGTGNTASPAACTTSLFKHLFGQTPTEFATDVTTRHIKDCAPAACGQALLAAHEEGWQVFSVDGDLALPADPIGSPDHPVLITAGGAIGFLGASPLHGLLFAQQPQWTATGNAADVRGAVVTCGQVDHPPLSSISHDATVLARLGSAGPLLRVPGSWHEP